MFDTADAHLLTASPKTVDPRDFLASLSDKIEGFFYRCLHDSAYTMLHVSSGFDRMLGRPGIALVQRQLSFSDLMHPEDLPACAAAINAAVAGRRRWRISYRMQRQDGAFIPVLETGGGVFDPKTGALLYLDGVVLDMSRLG